VDTGCCNDPSTLSLHPVQPMTRRTRPYEDKPTRDEGEYVSRNDGLHVNWTALATIIALFTWTVSGVWFAAGQSSSLNTATASIAQLQADEKENDKQRIEILLHLQSIDQTLKDWTHPPQVMTQPGGLTINTGDGKAK
jgi:hypothetical protein